MRCSSSRIWASSRRTTRVSPVFVGASAGTASLHSVAHHGHAAVDPKTSVAISKSSHCSARPPHGVHRQSPPGEAQGRQRDRSRAPPRYRADIVGSHRGTGRFLERRRRGGGHVHRTQPHLTACSRERGRRHGGCGSRLLPRASTHPGVPTLDIGNAKSGDCDPADSVLSHPVGATRVVAPRRLRPDVIVDLAPDGQHIGDRPPRGVGGWARFELRRDPLSIPLATAHRVADLRRSAVHVPAGEDPDFPDARSALAHRRHRRRP